MDAIKQEQQFLRHSHFRFVSKHPGAEHCDNLTKNMANTLGPRMAHFAVWEMLFIYLSFRWPKLLCTLKEIDTVTPVTFPAVPQVMSLLIDDDTAATKNKDRPLLASHLCVRP